MEYREIRASEIVDYANQVVRSADPVVPITPWRASSQAKNPDARPDDVLLMVALDKSKKIVGYIGLLPFQLPDTTTERIFWNTCWWVTPDAGAGVSMNLFFRFLKATGNRVVFSDMTEKTAEILRRIQGYQVSSRTGIVLRFRHAYHSRIRNNKKTYTVLRMFAATGGGRLVDTLLNIWSNDRIDRWLKDHPAPCTVGRCPEPNEQHLRFAREHACEGLTLPSIERFNWWKDHPWRVPADNDTRLIARRYFFSSISEQNDLYILECNCNESLTGLAIISNRDGVLKTHYLYYRSDSEHDFYQAIFRHFVTLPGAHTLVSFHEGFARFVSRQTFPMRIREAVRYTAFSATLKDIPGKNTRLQDGDGDYVFT